jgi:single-strand DNA-binding protein
MEQRSYENQAGEKRSAVELVADEIGPSLRWATAKVVRNERRTDGDSFAGGGGGGGGSASGGGGGGADGGERAPAAAAPRYEDEEPF